MSYDQSQVAFIDTETGGLDPEDHPVWEIAVIVDGEEYVWQQKIPNWKQWTPETHPMIDPWVVANTRLVQDYDDDAALDPFHSIANFESLVKGRHLVGACPWFDSERLHRLQLAESDHRDLLWHYHLIDVENLAVGYLAGLQAGGRQLVWKDDVIVGLTQDFHPLDEPWSPELPWNSTDLSKALGVDPADFEPKHSALADARWARALFEAIMGPPR